MKALALLSGGLDSTLAIRVLLEQGLTVEAINFTSPFCLCSGAKGDCHAATAAAARLGVSLHREACGQGYLDMVANPKYGYGKQMNPCLDCRIYKLRRAKDKMLEIGASFLVTGEVLDQRPMSQRRDTLDICERDAGLRGLILRPLSARLLRPSIPEEEGWVDREKLLAIQGRGRQPQFKLAHDLGVTDYPCPAGGCLLTYEAFGSKVRDLLTHEEGLTPWNTALLRIGRHFRLPGGTKVIVGRREEENERLAGLARENTYLFECRSTPGPNALAYGPHAVEEISLCASLVGHYADKSPAGTPCEITVRQGERENLIMPEHLAAENVHAWNTGER